LKELTIVGTKQIVGVMMALRLALADALDHLEF